MVVAVLLSLARSPTIPSLPSTTGPTPQYQLQAETMHQPAAVAGYRHRVS